MYDGIDDIQDEVRQNARDQQHPTQPHPILKAQAMQHALRTEQFSLPPGPAKIAGLSTRQMELINNKDTLPSGANGAARQRRLGIIERDITHINRFLPRLEEVRAYLATMSTDNDEALAEAKRLCDLKLRAFEREVTMTLDSLITEQELKSET